MLMRLLIKTRFLFLPPSSGYHRKTYDFRKPTTIHDREHLPFSEDHDQLVQYPNPGSLQR
ncbi:hypothetical protein N7463_008567 [Penicillium fimorum]|uniref:Uncharacterized protein n=1 Tax=Penicillium fimorum TaxID=1882269 RepID=A0A9W9XQ68_9EURO|nr:hypothetical protein N7463_008567 [Penicillium fimorum]